MKLTNEAKIGMMVSMVVVLLLVLTFKTGNYQFTKRGYEMKVHFKRIDGIIPNAPVLLNGLEVGLVKNIAMKEIDADSVMEITIWLQEQAKVKQGAKAYVKGLGFMGEKYVSLSSGDKGGGVLPPNSIILGADPADLDSILRDGKDITAEVKELATNLNERMKVNEEKIDRIFTNLDTSLDHAASFTTNLDERLKANEKHIDEIMVNLHSASANLDEFTYDLKLNPWKLLYRSKEKRKESDITQ